MRCQEQGLVGRYKGSVIEKKVPGDETFCLSTMVPKTDNMPQVQEGRHEKYKDGASDQGRALVKSVDQMEMDKIHTRSIQRSGTPIGADRGTYAPKEKKTINLGHVHPRQYDIFYIECQRSDRKKKIDPAQSKNS